MPIGKKILASIKPKAEVTTTKMEKWHKMSFKYATWKEGCAIVVDEKHGPIEHMPIVIQNQTSRIRMNSE